ncbi:MAG: DUF3472 domain-containing protein [Acidobacteria bacterium]|nr:DUF3472 domain-containing protein [Acidobacteriota bacterium]
MVYNDASFDGDIVINQVRVPKNGEAMYTYYEALGWGGKAAGYAGIQAHPKAHNYIFSIWDHKEHTAPIKAVHRGPGTLTEKFGGEGTGLKSWNFELGWDTDVWYTLVARCWPVDDHTFYGYWVRSHKTEQWTHMVTMDVGAKDAYFKGGNDSFIEDWLETGKNARTTHIRNGWKRKRSGEWHAFGSARYSVNSWDLTEGKRSFNFRTNWNGGVAKDAGGEFYFMTAGGKQTKPTTTNPSTHSIKRSGTKSPDYTAIKIQSGKVGAAGEHAVAVTWQNDAKTLPQFSFTITAHDNPEGKGEPLARSEKIEAHTRAAELALPKNVDPKTVHLRLTCRDILGNQSAVLAMRLVETAER